MKLRLLLTQILVVTTLSACAQNVELIKTMSATIRNDVFQELPEGPAIPPGYTDLHILASLKTHKPGIYPSKKKHHGTADYMLLLNIDGQSTRVKGNLKEEKSKQRFLQDPEAGDGIRYYFRKDVRLKAGPHRIAVAIPDDDIVIVKEVVLLEGISNILVLEPVYGGKPVRQRHGLYGPESFSEGVKGFREYLNGHLL